MVKQAKSVLCNCRRWGKQFLKRHLYLSVILSECRLNWQTDKCYFKTILISSFLSLSRKIAKRKLKTVPDHVIFVFPAHSNCKFRLHSGADECTKTMLWSSFFSIFRLNEKYLRKKICHRVFLSTNISNIRCLVLCFRFSYSKTGTLTNIQINSSHL